MYGRKNCKLLLVNTEIFKMSTDRQFLLAELEQPCSLTARRIKVFPVQASPVLDEPPISLSLLLNRKSSVVALAPSLKEAQCNCSRGTHGVPNTKYPKRILLSVDVRISSRFMADLVLRMDRLRHSLCWTSVHRWRLLPARQGPSM